MQKEKSKRFFDSELSAEGEINVKIIKNKVEEIMIKSGYICKKKYSDGQLNLLLNCWIFFEEKEKEIQKLSGESSDIILYSKYYWCMQYKNRFNELYGKDVGIDQQQYKIIEEMTQRIEDVNWNFIQMMEEEKYDLQMWTV